MEIFQKVKPSDMLNEDYIFGLQKAANNSGALTEKDITTVTRIIKAHLNKHPEGVNGLDVTFSLQLPDPFETKLVKVLVVGDEGGGDVYPGGGYIFICYLEDGSLHITFNRPDLMPDWDPLWDTGEDHLNDSLDTYGGVIPEI